MTTVKKTARAKEPASGRTETHAQPSAEQLAPQPDLEAILRQLHHSPATATELVNTAHRKTRKTLTLDDDLVAEFGGGADERQLSPTINAVLRVEKARRDQLRALDALLTRLAAEDGPVDPERVRHFEDLIG